jgi:hypothetical protein
MTTLISLGIVLALCLWPARWLSKFAANHQTTSASLLGRSFVRLVAGYPWSLIAAVPFALLGVVIGGLLGWPARIEPFTSFLGAIALPLWYSVWKVCKSIKANASATQLGKKWLTAALPNLDYFHTSPIGGVGICASTSEIAFVMPGMSSAHKVAASKLKSINAVQPELMQAQIFGARGIQDQDARLDVARYNLEQRHDHVAQTGLALQLDDIQLPSVHITMSFASAKQWSVLLDQLARGVLPPTMPAQQIPAS